MVIALIKLKLLLSGTLNENGELGDKNVQVSKALTIGLQLVSHKKCKVLSSRLGAFEVSNILSNMVR